LRDVHVQANLTSGRIGDVTLADIPPCTIEKHRIAPPPGDTFAKAGNRLTGYSGLWLRFWVDGRHWQLTSDQLSETRGYDVPASAGRLRNIPIDNAYGRPGATGDGPQEALVQDCGEGG
jgi:hypothetical protein